MIMPSDRCLLLRRHRQRAAHHASFVIVDARTGVVLKRWEGLTTANIGTGPVATARPASI